MPNQHGPIDKRVPKYPRKTLEKFELKPKPFDMGFVSSWTVQTWLGATISPTPDHIFTWNSHKTDSPRHREETLHRILARFARLIDQQAFERGLKQTSTCSTCPGTPEHAQALGPARPRQATPDLAPSPTPMPIKQPEAVTILPCTPSAPPEHEFAGVLSMHGVPSAARARPLWTSHSGPPPSNPAPQLASLEPHRASRALKPSATSPEAPDCHCRLQLTVAARGPNCTVSHFQIPCTHGTIDFSWSSSSPLIKPYHHEQAGAAPPTSPTACARGQPSSGHHYRRSAPRRDRQRPPNLARPFAGPLPSPVSRATAFSLLGYFSGEEGVRVREGKDQGVKC
jgi:hypothetical protein